MFFRAKTDMANFMKSRKNTLPKLFFLMVMISGAVFAQLKIGADKIHLESSNEMKLNLEPIVQKIDTINDSLDSYLNIFCNSSDITFKERAKCSLVIQIGCIKDLLARNLDSTKSEQFIVREHITDHLKELESLVNGSLHCDFFIPAARQIEMALVEAKNDVRRAFAPPDTALQVEIDSLLAQEKQLEYKVMELRHNVTLIERLVVILSMFTFFAAVVLPRLH